MLAEDVDLLVVQLPDFLGLEQRGDQLGDVGEGVILILVIQDLLRLLLLLHLLVLKVLGLLIVDRHLLLDLTWLILVELEDAGVLWRWRAKVNSLLLWALLSK